MPNWCNTNYRVIGEAKNVERLAYEMKELENLKRSKKAIEELSVEEKKTLASILLTLEKARIETRRSNLYGKK